MKKILIFLAVITTPLWGPILFVLVLGLIPGEKFYYEVTESSPPTNLIGESYLTKLPLVIVQNYPQPYKTKGSQRLNSFSQGTHPPDSSCTIITQKTNRLLDTLLRDSFCYQRLPYSKQKQLWVQYLPKGSLLKVKEQYQLIEYKRPKKTSRKFTKELLLLEDPQGNLIETSVDFFNDHVVNSTVKIDISSHNLSIQDVMEKIEKDGFIKVLVCASNSIEGYKLTELTRFIDDFYFNEKPSLDFLIDIQGCPNAILLGFYSKNIYIKTLYLSNLVPLLKGDWKILD